MTVPPFKSKVVNIEPNVEEVPDTIEQPLGRRKSNEPLSRRVINANEDGASTNSTALFEL